MRAVTGGKTNVTGNKHSDRRRGPEARQDTDRGAEKHANETVKQIRESRGRL